MHLPSPVRDVLLAFVLGCARAPGVSSDAPTPVPPTAPIANAGPGVEAPETTNTEAPTPRTFVRTLTRATIDVCKGVSIGRDGRVWVSGVRRGAEGDRQVLANVGVDDVRPASDGPGSLTDVDAHGDRVLVTGLGVDGTRDHAMFAAFSFEGERTIDVSIPGAVLGLTFDDVVPLPDGALLVGSLNPIVSGQTWMRIARLDAQGTLRFEKTFEEAGYNMLVQGIVRGDTAIVVGSRGIGGAYDPLWLSIDLASGALRARGEARAPTWEFAIGVVGGEPTVRVLGLTQAAQPGSRYDASLVVWTLDDALRVRATRRYGEHLAAATRPLTVDGSLATFVTTRRPDGALETSLVRIAPNGDATWTPIEAPTNVEVTAMDHTPEHGFAFVGRIAAAGDDRCHVARVGHVP